MYDGYNGKMRSDDFAGTLTQEIGNPNERHSQKVVLPVLTPDRIEKKQTGMFVELSNGAVVYAVWYPKYKCYVAIRKLTPRECFRLQGWEDEYFERAEMVNSDSQLYKQAGNGVTVNVVEVIGKRLKEIEDGKYLAEG